MKKWFVWFGVLVIVLGLASSAKAALITSISVNGTTYCAVDNNAFACAGTQISDDNPLPGILTYPGLLNLSGLLVSGSVQTAISDSLHDLLTTNSIEIVNSTGALIHALVAVSATDFIGPTSKAFTTASGTWIGAAGSSASLSYWNDPTNSQGAESPLDLPGLLVHSFFDAAVGGLDSFSENAGPFAVSDLGLFSMSLGMDLSLRPGGILNSRGQAIEKVPEPALMALFALALGGASYRLRRTKSS